MIRELRKLLTKVASGGVVATAPGPPAPPPPAPPPPELLGLGLLLPLVPPPLVESPELPELPPFGAATAAAAHRLHKQIAVAQSRVEVFIIAALYTRS